MSSILDSWAVMGCTKSGLYVIVITQVSREPSVFFNEIWIVSSQTSRDRRTWREAAMFMENHQALVLSSWWRHQMETFSALLALHRLPMISPHKGQWRGVLMLSLICAWIDGWVNNREAGDLGRHRAPYDVTVVFLICLFLVSLGFVIWGIINTFPGA